MSIFAATLLGLSMAQAPVDYYQKVGNEVGEVFNSIGSVLNSGNHNAEALSSAGQQADFAIASLRNQVNSYDWSYLGPAVAEHQMANLRSYMNNLDVENARLHAMASQAAVDERMNAKPSQVKAFSGPTNMPRMQNKAVIKAETLTTTDAPAETSSAESKSESKESKSESKSESKQSKAESKSEAKESKDAAKTMSEEAKSTSTMDTVARNSSETSATKSSHHSKNGATVAGLTGGAAIVAAVFAML